MIEKVLSFTLALATLAACRVPPAPRADLVTPCARARPGAWTPMSVEGAPEIVDMSGVKTGLLGHEKWWLWDTSYPLADSRVFDARCNAWRPTTMAKGPPIWLWRDSGMMSRPDGGIVVFGPKLAPADDKMGARILNELAVFELDPEALQWRDITPKLPVFNNFAEFVYDDHHLMIWDSAAGTGALFTDGRWETFAGALPPHLVNNEECSFFLGGGWYTVSAAGVDRFDLASKVKVTVRTAAPRPPGPPAAPGPVLGPGYCTVTFSGGFAVATLGWVSAKERIAFGIEGATAFQIPWPEEGEKKGEVRVLIAGAGAAWSTLLHQDDDTDVIGEDGDSYPLQVPVLFQRYDRATGKWTSPPLPSGVTPEDASLIELRGQARLVHGNQMYVWDGQRFGPPRPLAVGPEDVPAPPKWQNYRELGPELLVTWGILETRAGSDCHNPFYPPRPPPPDQPICDSSGTRVIYKRINPGGSFFLRAR